MSFSIKQTEVGTGVELNTFLAVHDVDTSESASGGPQSWLLLKSMIGQGVLSEELFFPVCCTLLFAHTGDVSSRYPFGLYRSKSVADCCSLLKFLMVQCLHLKPEGIFRVQSSLFSPWLEIVNS